MLLMESSLDFCDLFVLGRRLGESLLNSDDSTTGQLMLQLLFRLFITY